MPLTALTTVLGSLTMFGSWALVSHRLANSTTPVSHQVTLLNRFFLFMGIFFLIMFLPNIVLSSNPATFPTYMAWGYIIGHVFFYAALTSIAQLMFSMVPRLAGKSGLALVLGTVIGSAITIVNIITMAYGVKPQYDFIHSVILFNAHPVVGAGIAIFAAVAIFPTAILLIMNGIRNHSARVRSLLLGAGFLIMMSAGPLHDTARTFQLYAAADLLSMFSMLVVTGGVLYRFEDRLAPAKAVSLSPKQL
jgi:hypothetical protein